MSHLAGHRARSRSIGGIRIKKKCTADLPWRTPARFHTAWAIFCHPEIRMIRQRVLSVNVVFVVVTGNSLRRIMSGMIFHDLAIALGSTSPIENQTMASALKCASSATLHL